MIILVDKPMNITSHGVVSKIKYELKKKNRNLKVGHSGTLDPICTGVLPILIGRDTKLLPYLSGNKAYTATMLLGTETDTEDITGKVLSEKPVSATLEDVSAVANEFVGKIKQIPPMYSAIKMNGKKLYDLAREGIVVDRKEREVEIYSLSVRNAEIENQYILDVSCSSGTYIRTLTADIGKKLGCGGCMATLRRTVSNGFSVDKAYPLETVLSAIAEDKLSEIAIFSEDIFASSPSVILPENAVKYYLNGGEISVKRISEKISEGTVRVYSPENNYLGIGISERGSIKAIINYQTEV